MTTMTMTVDASGALAGMDRLTKVFADKLDAYVGLIAADLDGQSKVEAPVRTGFLRGSIHFEKVKQFEYLVAASASYAGYVHDGTRFIAPNPFLSRAKLIIIAKWSGKGFEFAA